MMNEHLLLAATLPTKGEPRTQTHAPTNEDWALRTISYNILGARGYLGKGEPKHPDLAAMLKAQMPTRLVLELALYRPDIVTFSEAPSKEVVAHIANELRMEHVFFPGGWSGNEEFPGGFPGAVLTSGKIVESQNRPMVSPDDPSLFTRHWGRAVVRKDEREVVVFSLHTYYKRADAEQDRQPREFAEAMKVVKKDLDAGRDVLLQGDLNQTPDAPEHKLWVEMGMVDLFEAVGTGPKLSFPSTTPRVRLDYIWASRNLAAKARNCRIVAGGGFGMHGDDEWAYALSDHLPIMATLD